MSEPLEVLASCLSKLQDASSSSTFTVQFPSIICVGSQSAGKSSIIETIVGHAFLPRGGDIVTRCPLHIRSEKVESLSLNLSLLDSIGPETVRPSESCSPEIRSIVWRKLSSTTSMM